MHMIYPMKYNNVTSPPFKKNEIHYYFFYIEQIEQIKLLYAFHLTIDNTIYNNLQEIIMINFVSVIAILLMNLNFLYSYIGISK